MHIASAARFGHIVRIAHIVHLRLRIELLVFPVLVEQLAHHMRTALRVLPGPLFPSVSFAISSPFESFALSVLSALAVCFGVVGHIFLHSENRMGYRTNSSHRGVILLLTG